MASRPLPDPPRPDDASVIRLLDALDDPVKRADSERLIELMSSATGQPPAAWGGSIIGFGSYHYRYASGHEGIAPLIGFSPRARAISLYASCADVDRDDLLARLGRHTSGKGCVYVKRLSDLDEGALVELLDASVAVTRAMDVTGDSPT